MSDLPCVHIEQSGRRIEPFLDPIGETFIQSRSLQQWQEEAIRDAGLRIVDKPNPPCLIIPDTLFITGDAIKQFLAGAAGKNAQLVLKHSVFAKTTTPVQPGVEECADGYLFKAVRFDAGNDETPKQVVVDPEEKVLSLPTPEYYYGSDKIELSLPKKPIITLHHWIHILWINQYAGSIEIRTLPKWKLVVRGLWALLRARSFNKWKFLSKFNRIGKNCDIHPTAVIEGSTLGNGVKVGPYARILFSNVGDESLIMACAQLELCQLGERSLVSQRVYLRCCVLYPEAVAGQYLMQQCILGRQAITTNGAFSLDLNFEKPIRVKLDGQLLSSGQQLLGSAFGHRSKIGTGIWMAPGRSVPNDVFLLRDPETILSKLEIPDGASGPLVVKGDHLEAMPKK